MKKHDEIREHEISGKEKVHSENFRFDVKDEVVDFVSDEEGKFVNGRRELPMLLLFSGQ